MENKIKLCECGCGKPAPISKENRTRNGYIKGQPTRFIKGHGSRVVSNPLYFPKSLWDDLEELYINQHLSTIDIAEIKGCTTNTVSEHLKKLGIATRNNSKQQSNRFKNTPPTHQLKMVRNGYVLIYQPDHPLADQKGYVLEHRLVVEKRIGRYLLRSEPVHHINGIRDDNRDENLQLLTPHDHSTKTLLCQQCPLRKEIRLLRWQMKELTKSLQIKF